MWALGPWRHFFWHRSFSNREGLKCFNPPGRPKTFRDYRRADYAGFGLYMRDFLLAIVFLAGTVLLLGGCLYHDKLLSVEGAAIGFGAVLCALASIAKDRIDRDMTF